MRQVSKERSTVLKVECWDAIQIAINRKENHHRKGIRKSSEKEVEIERERDLCNIEKCISQEIIVPLFGLFSCFIYIKSYHSWKSYFFNY